MQIQATNRYVLIELQLRESSILTPDVSGPQIDPDSLVVHSIGHLVESCKPGDRIIIWPSVTPIIHEHDGKKLWFINEEAVVGKYVKE